MKQLKGVCVPVCTPFDTTGEKLDESALRAHIDSMIDAGVHIILVCGGTGEFAYLRSDEKRRIAEIASEQIAGRAAFMVHTSAINTVDTIEFSKHAADLGADAVMVLPPYFEGPDLRGVRYHYEAVANAVDVPIMVYNIPQNSGIDIKPDFFAQLLEMDNIRYIKDSTGDFVRIQELLQTGGGVFNGGDPITYASLAAGCPGCVWGSVNVIPNEAVQLYELVSAGNLSQARQLWAKILPSQLFYWSHVYNAAVKASTNLSGRPVGPCRKPVLELTGTELRELERALAPLGIRTPSEQEVAV